MLGTGNQLDAAKRMDFYSVESDSGSLSQFFMSEASVVNYYYNAVINKTPNIYPS